MKFLTPEEFEMNKFTHLESLKKGAVFLYPTDTIYGIGCDATNHEAVYKTREAKQRYTRPFSIIAPSKKWIQSVRSRSGGKRRKIRDQKRHSDFK